jgi:hypothetical protein
MFERIPINQLFKQTQLQYFNEQKDNNNATLVLLNEKININSAIILCIIFLFFK